MITTSVTNTRTNTFFFTHLPRTSLLSPLCLLPQPYFNNRLSIVETYEDLSNLLNFLQRTLNPSFSSSVLQSNKRTHTHSSPKHTRVTSLSHRFLTCLRQGIKKDTTEDHAPGHILKKQITPLKYKQVVV